MGLILAPYLNGRVNTVGLSSSSPALSAMAIYLSDNAVVDGVYWLKNIYTGNVTRQAFCKFNVDGNHYQRWSLTHLAGYQNNGNFGATGAMTLNDTADIINDSNGINTKWDKQTGSYTGAGGSTTFDTGLSTIDLAGHVWVNYQYQNIAGGGGWQNSFDLDWAATANQTSWGSNYTAELYGMNNYNLGANGTHGLSRLSFTSSTAIDNRYTTSALSYADAWVRFGDLLTNGISKTGGAPIAGYYIGVRLAAFSDSVNGQTYHALWAHIPA